MWMTLFFVSAVLNITAALYVRWLLIHFRNVGEDLESTNLLIQEYVGHVRSVYELEMFYGDATLESLMKHGSSLVTTIGGVDYLLNDPPANEEEEEEIETSEG